MQTLVPADTADAILPAYRGTPIESLLRYHNLGADLPPTAGHAHLLIGMCMDHRKDLVLPSEFAYVLRSAGGSLRDSEFEVSSAPPDSTTTTPGGPDHWDTLSQGTRLPDPVNSRPMFLFGADMMRLALAFLVLAACAKPAPEAAPAGSAAPGAPWTLTDVQPDTSNGIRVLVLHDMEGLSGQDDPRTFNFGTPQYPHGQELLAGDINAVVDGLFAGGATAVDVVDGHGSGNPDPDVRRDLLNPRAQQILRDTAFDSYFDLVAPGAYDAVAVVGMHAKTGSGGFASHTFTLGIELIVNGSAITETELVGLSWGREGIPVIFGSGDDRLAKDLTTMPWIEFVTVKRALAADSAEPRPLEEARADLRAKAQRAMENLRAGKAKAMRVSKPITAALHAVPPADISILDGVPGISYADNRVTFQTDDLAKTYQGLVKLVGVATTGYNRVLAEEIRAQPRGSEMMAAFGRRLELRWFDVESGRWTKPAPRQPPAGKKYHGYQ